MRARRWWGWPLVPVYAAVLMVKDGLRRVGVLRTRRLGWPVVSVGSLSAGGAGKTPVVIALAELLRVRGWHVDVLTRGYGRDSSDDSLKDFAAQVVPDAEDAAARYGDEPTLIAQKTGVPVWVSEDRFFAGRSAESFATEEIWNFVSETVVEIEEAEPVRGVHLLDDGFQHRGLGRTVDVVLVTAEDLEDALLPAGNRREGLRALRRADVVVVREEELAEVEGRVRGWMRKDAAVWCVRRELVFSAQRGESKSQRTQRKRESTEGSGAGLDSSTEVGGHAPGAKAPLSGWGDERPEAEASGYLEAKAKAESKAQARAQSEARGDTNAGAETKPGAGAGERVVAFCGISRAEGFWGMLAKAGCEVVGRVEFGDHHRYGMVDVERVARAAKECGAAGFVTTEKDAVKLTVEMRRRLEEIGPVCVAGLEVTFLDEAAVVRDVELRIGEERIG